jgi:hypothetical protein
MFSELERYRERFGNCNVPDKWNENPPLGSWVVVQRIWRKKGNLSSVRVARLDELGFNWDPLNASWEEMFSALRLYRDEHGDCNVSRWGDNAQLGRWVSKQRSLQKSRKLTTERKTRLDALGFVWAFGVQSARATWETMFAELTHYKERFGHCNVPREWRESPQLSGWVTHQRSNERSGWLSAARKERLDVLGFLWDPKPAAWETMFSELERYRERFGNCNVPAKWPENPRLASWVTTQRAFKDKGKLTSPREKRLNEIGFVWDPFEALWETKFAELKLYKERFGDCNVPARWKEHPRLATWVGEQRSGNAEGGLTSERKSRLDKLGFVWNLNDSNWDIMFTELERYRNQQGDCNVPHEWGKNPQLGRWVSRQRGLEKSGKLHAARKARLDELGFIWDTEVSSASGAPSR